MVRRRRQVSESWLDRRESFPDLNQRQNAFVWGIIDGKSAKEAYIQAGYSARGNSAETKASRLVRNGKVQEALACAREEIAERTMVTKEYVMRELRCNYERAMQLTPVFDKEGSATGEYIYQPMAAIRALELMGKALGMFKNKVEVGGGLEPIKMLTVVQTVPADEGSQVTVH